jgi:phosphate transport system substrate-binding protein
MQFGRNDRATRRRVTLVAATLVTTIAGALSITGAAGAAAKPAAASSPYSSYYSQLSSDEALAHSGDSISEAGSTLFQPLWGVWADSKPLGLTINSAGGGSGAGKTDAETNTIQIGAADFPRFPSDPSTFVSVPVLVSAQEVIYNVPGVSKSTHIKLNASILNGIYSGSITSWNAKAIQSVNKGVSLPSTPIIPIYRTGSTGDSFLFTSYINAGDDTSFVASSGPSPAPSWPKVAAALGEGSSATVASGCEATPGCIAYEGSSFLRGLTVNASIGIAELQNGDGNYVNINNTNILNEMNSVVHLGGSNLTPLIYAKNKAAKSGWPIVAFEYALVNNNVSNANDVKAVLAWAMDPRNGSDTTNLSPFFFHPLPPAELARALSVLSGLN